MAQSRLAKNSIEKPAESFYIGQAITCRVVSADPAADKLALTFILDGSDEGTGKPQKRKLVSPEMETLPELKKSKASETVVQGAVLSVGQVKVLYRLAVYASFGIVTATVLL